MKSQILGPKSGASRFHRLEKRIGETGGAELKPMLMFGPHKREAIVKTIPLAGIFLTFALCSGCEESRHAAPASAAVTEVKPAPAGEATVQRGETTLQISVAEAFAQARDNDQIQLGPGRVLATGTFTLKQVRGVNITGPGTTLVAKSDIPVVHFEDCVDVTLDGVHVVHEIGEYCSQACVEVVNCVKTTIMNCDLDGSGYWGIGMWNVEKGRILNNLFHNCHDGFFAMDAQQTELRGNTFKGNRNKDINAPEGIFVNDPFTDNIFATAEDATDPGHLITATSVGPLKLGMTVAEARKALTGLKLDVAPGSEGYTTLGAWDGENLVMELGAYSVRPDDEGHLPPIDENEKIASALVLDPRYRTKEGVRVGTPVEKAEEHYGKLKRIFFDQHSGEFGIFANAPEGFSLMLSGKEDHSTAGNYTDTEEIDYGRLTTKINPGAVISGIGIE